MKMRENVCSVSKSTTLVKVKSLNMEDDRGERTVKEGLEQIGEEWKKDR